MSQPQRSSLATGEVARRLKTTRTTLQNMFDHIPHLYVLKKETRLFPTAYIDAYAAYLAREELPATIDSAASFWRTDVAQRLYAEAVARLNVGLAQPTLTGQELAGVLGVPYSTVMNWSSTGALVAVRTRKGVLFPGEKVKTAIVWKKPTTRKPYVPPTLPTMFVSADYVNAKARQRGRALPSGTALFGQLQTPGSGRTIPATYVEALLRTRGALDDQRVLRFNADRRTRTIMQEARAEFDRRLAERQQLSPFDDGLLTFEDVAWLLGMTTSIVKIWCANGQLAYVAGPGKRLIQPSVLLARCKWVLPTGR